MRQPRSDPVSPLLAFHGWRFKEEGPSGRDRAYRSTAGLRYPLFLLVAESKNNLPTIRREIIIVIQNDD
jgi:hypothetical protein